jgi:hypothetical protein
VATTPDTPANATANSIASANTQRNRAEVEFVAI